MSDVKDFQRQVYHIYYKVPRSVEMPWRQDYSPYRVLLSEFMLQQTQVSRVVEYFERFIALWPRIEDLANAGLQDLLFHWQGLGYNRRGKFLHQCAKEIVQNFGGEVPQDKESLLSLPGIGQYTHSAIQAFAFNLPVVVLETNIRRAVIHHFFRGRESIAEAEIVERVEAVLDASNPRCWYWALMDYGSFLSKKIENPNRRSIHYRKQSKFSGSNRQIRGSVLRVLLQHSAPSLSKKELIASVCKELMSTGEIIHFEVESREALQERISNTIQALEKERLIERIAPDGILGDVSDDAGKSEFETFDRELGESSIAYTVPN